MPPQVDVSTGNVSLGDLEIDHNFEFTIPTAITKNVTITPENSSIKPYQWFTPNPATITAGSTSVTVEAVEASPAGGWLTYSVTGMNVQDTNPHIVVSDGIQAEKAS
jgi:hypothetical protein